MIRLRRLPHPQTDLREVYRAVPDVPADSLRLEMMRAQRRPSLREIARAGAAGPEAMIDLLEREVALRDGG